MSLAEKNEANLDESLEFALEILRTKWVTLEQLCLAQDARRGRCPSIGKLALVGRKLSVSQAGRVLDRRAFSDLSFGDIAVQMGFMTSVDLSKLQHDQKSQFPSLSNTLVAEGLITIEQAEKINKRINSQTMLQSKYESKPIAKPHMKMKRKNRELAGLGK